MARVKKGFFQELARNKILYLMFVPIALYYIVLAYIPMSGSIMAFQEYNNQGGIWLSPWIGLKNFEYFFYSGKAVQVTLNTVMFNLVFIACYTFFSLLVAIFVAEMRGKIFKKTAQSLMFLPYFISWVVVSSMVNNFFNYDYGIVNQALQAFGQPPIDTASNPDFWIFFLPVVYSWKWVGFGSVLYLAAITGIDQDVYEAATIDGANMFRKIWHITLPGVRQTMVILILLSVGNIMRGEFDMFYNLIGTNGVLIDKTDIIDTLVFRSIVGTQDFGMAAAAGLYQSVLCLIIIVTVNAIVKRAEKDYALF